MHSTSASPVNEQVSVITEDHHHLSQPPAVPEVADTSAANFSAYYSLHFPSITYYLQTLSVTIGRRPVRQGTNASSSSLSAEQAAQVDVDLGPLKSVSRLHARIEYEEDDGRFVLVVLGRNGAWVDSIWSGSGSRVPLGARSQIQIATRVFHFVLPPPPTAPEDSPTPSSPSTTRHESPSVDVTSLSPPSTLPSPHAPIAALPEELKASETPPVLNTSKPLPSKVNGKKRKKRESEPEQPPDVMPPRPTYTYAQLCYRGIRALNGKATLQEICMWVSETFIWYRFNKACGWESSVRHNLSSNRAFKKMERCAGERGKGFFWSIDSKFEHMFEDQDDKPGKDGLKGKSKGGKSNNVPLDPPLKRSVKGDAKTPLPPPLTSAPLPAFNTTAFVPNVTTAPPSSAGVPPSLTGHLAPTGHIKSEPGVSSTSNISQGPQSPQGQSLELGTSHNPNLPPVPPDMIVPIVIGPPSQSSPTAGLAVGQSGTDTDGNNFDLSYPPIALKGDTIILNPAIFSNLTPEQLKELEALGARKAIEILQTYIVRFLKVKIKTEGAKGKGKKKSKAKRSDAANATTQVDGANPSGASKDQAGDSVSSHPRPKSKVDTSMGPFTTAPLLPRKPSTQAKAIPSAIPPSLPETRQQAPSRTATPMVSGLQAAVEPLRISSPPASRLADPADEIIDIMGDDTTSGEEPVAKRRRVDAEEMLVDN